MPTSKKKILANRRNSKKSTGPVSNEGKLKSSLNSIKHGLYGDKIAIIGENVDDINDIIDLINIFTNDRYFFSIQTMFNGV